MVHSRFDKRIESEHSSDCQCNDCENYILSCQIAQLENILRRMSLELAPVLQRAARDAWFTAKTQGDKMDFSTYWTLHGKRA
jgi:hypothetical protein